MASKISFQKYDKNLMAMSVLRDMPISRKLSIEILDNIRNKKAEYAIKLLDDVIAMKKPIALKKFTGDVGHKRGHMAAGRFPVKAATHIKKAVVNAAKNAVDKGFSENLVIIHASAMKGTGNYHYGRHSGREAKSTTIEIVVKEAADKVKPKVENKETKKAQPVKAKEEKKVEPKKELPKVEKKTEEKKPEVKAEPVKEEPKVEEKKEQPKPEVKEEKKEEPKVEQKSQSQEAQK